MCETHGLGDDVVGRSIVTDRYKYTAYAELMHELYDLQDDPYELRNLIDDRAYGKLRGTMRRRLANWQERTLDGAAVLP